MSQKYKQNKYRTNVNFNLMEENIIQIKSGITINVDASVKNMIYMRKNIFGILLHIVSKMAMFSKYYLRLSDYL